MKPIFIILGVLISFNVLSQRHKSKICISITKTTPYCGGANPSEEILEEARKKKIPVGEKFYIIKGWCNDERRKIVDSSVMDTSGNFLVRLKPGFYSIINNYGYKIIEIDTNFYDIKCLTKAREIPLFKFEVSKKKSNKFSFDIFELCPYNKPCYKGNLKLPM